MYESASSNRRVTYFQPTKTGTLETSRYLSKIGSCDLTVPVSFNENGFTINRDGKIHGEFAMISR